MDVDQIVKRYESRIALSVLGEFVLLGMDGVGSFALSSNKTALFAQALGTYLQGIATAFNTQAIPKLMRLNGWTDAENYPKLVFSDIETPDVQEIAGALSGLVTAGVITPDDELEGWVRDFANLPKAQSATSRDMGIGSIPDLEAEINEPDEDMVREVPELDIPEQEDQDEEGEGIETTAETPVSAVTLNGAQVSSLLEIIQNVAAGSLPRGSGVEIIATAFNLSPDKADSIMGSVGQGFVPDKESSDD